MSSVDTARDVFRAVSDPTRRSMLDLLRDGERSAGELGEPFEMSRPAVSQHLRVLQDAGLIRGHQQGRTRVYRLTPKPLKDVCQWADRYTEVADPAGHQWRIRRAAPVRQPEEDGTQRSDPAAPGTSGPEHRQLEGLAGSWTLSVETRVAPDADWTPLAGSTEPYGCVLRIEAGDRFTIEMRSPGPGSAEFTNTRLTGTRRAAATPPARSRIG